jgi:EAL domain-containing protein (putative c-di-GMP-specific phosphodiesterase class I)
VHSATLHAGAHTGTVGQLDEALTAGLRTVYQPIVSLADGGVVGYEALTRGPAGGELESPLALFAAARAEQRVPELDRACRSAALSDALSAGLRQPATLFLNAEPEALEIPATGPIRESAIAAGADLQLCIELTERALTARPAELLAAVDRLRREGFMIALDDVGVDPRSLALLPLLRPDIVKLDISLIHGHPSRRSGEVMNGVCAYAEQTGATILAEGIERESHLIAAESLGASLAQGWYFGRPAPAAELRPVTGHARALAIQARPPVSSPVELVHEHRPFTVGRKDVLLSVTRALEAQALELGGHAVVISTFQHARHFTPGTARRYAELARRAAFTAALGIGLGPEPAPGVRGITLDAGDVLVGEWDIAVLGPHYAGALVARDLGDDGPDRERRFEFVLTFERTLVADVAAALISRLT